MAVPETAFPLLPFHGSDGCKLFVCLPDAEGWRGVYVEGSPVQLQQSSRHGDVFVTARRSEPTYFMAPGMEVRGTGETHVGKQPKEEGPYNESCLCKAVLSVLHGRDHTGPSPLCCCAHTQSLLGNLTRKPP